MLLPPKTSRKIGLQEDGQAEGPFGPETVPVKNFPATLDGVDPLINFIGYRRNLPYKTGVPSEPQKKRISEMEGRVCAVQVSVRVEQRRPIQKCKSQQ